MSQNISPDWLQWLEVKALARIFAARGAPLRFVGGCVRDALLGNPAGDIDAATPLPPEPVMALLEAAGARAIPTGIDHGTVTAVVEKRAFEITTLRRDVACDGRHAEVSFTDDWQEDAARRDFSINAMFLSPEGELFDYFGGQKDLKAGRVRFIGGAAQRISEDYLRILRFFRFYAWHGKTAPEASALAACADAASHIGALSGERIQKEMLKLLAACDPAPSLSLMHQYRVATHVFGGEIAVENLAPLMELETKPDPLARLAALIGDAEQSAWLSPRWKLSGHDSAQLRAISQIIPPDASEAAQKKILYEFGPEIFARRVLVSAARAGSAKPYAVMAALPQRWQAPEFPVSGDDLKKLGFKEGKELGDTLRRLEEIWIGSDYTLSKEALLPRA